MKYLLASLLLSASPLLANASLLADARPAIEAQAGCYEVTFEFMETFQRQKDVTHRSKPYFEQGLEWVEVVESNADRISLQHVLLTPDGPQKHWRQVWERNPSEAWKFIGDSRWRKEPLPPGTPETWLQRVYQVDDGPRYECAAPWMLNSDKPHWECSTWSPLPRREFTQRSDYNVLARRNRHEITADGWRHEQDNGKLKVFADGTALLAEEKGYNTYRRVADTQCQAGRDWWQHNSKVWTDIQAVWDDIYATRKQIHLIPSIDGRPLWMDLFDFAQRTMIKDSYDSNAVRTEAAAIIETYMKK